MERDLNDVVKEHAENEGPPSRGPWRQHQHMIVSAEDKPVALLVIHNDDHEANGALIAQAPDLIALTHALRHRYHHLAADCAAALEALATQDIPLARHILEEALIDANGGDDGP
jgi:hypothetical protein